MLVYKANRLRQKWSLGGFELKMPIHKFIMYLVGIIVSSAGFAIILSALSLLPIKLYVAIQGNQYFYLSTGVCFLLLLTVLLLSVYYLARNRSHYTMSGGLLNNIKCELRTTSFVVFLWIALIISPLTGIALGYFIDFELIFKTDIRLSLSIVVFLGLLFVIGGYRKTGNEHLRFAPGATENDEFGYKPIAIKDMERIVNSTKHILVANINGRLGEGKSSYLRMMVDSQNQDDFLYSFISLTETNETKSFSKLFAERWAETLNSRYPSATNSAKGSLLDNIFRESGHYMLLMLRTAFSTSRWPLRKTRVVYAGDNYLEEQFVPYTMSSLFSFVPHFKEKYWIVVIDEVERARFDEIYRTIETIERFRMESQWGLPIKLIFVLCTDRLGLRDRIAGNRYEKETAELIDSFFEKEPKTIDMHIDLPPVSPDKKQAFLLRIEREWLINRYGINVQAIEHPDTKQTADLEVYWPLDMIGGSDFTKGRLDDKKAHDFMVRTLLRESPRTIKKVFEETERFMAVFLASGQRKPDQIRISDVILLHYLKYKHVSALRFLYNVHPRVFSEFYEKFKGEEVGRMMRYFSTRNEENQLTFPKLFKEETGLDLPEDEVNEIGRILEIICYPIFEYIATTNSENGEFDYEYSDKPNYDRTLGLPENMWDALRIATENIQDESDYLVTQRYEIYTHQNKKLPPRLMRSGSDLLVFARNMRRYYPGDYVVSGILAERIARVLSTRRLVRRFPGSLNSESPYKNLQYQFSFHLANFLDRQDVSDQDIDRGFEWFRQVIVSEDTMLEAKIAIINNLFVYANSSNRGSIELDHARKALESRHNSEVRMLIQDVFNNGLDIYLPGKGKSIYDFEENYYYALYQMWSGDPSDVANIEKIRKIALNGLQKHHGVIGQYWSNRFPTKSESHVDNPELPITIHKLIEVTAAAGLTKQYQEYIDHWANELKKRVSPLAAPPLNDAFATTKQQLKKRGYL